MMAAFLGNDTAARHSTARSTRHRGLLRRGRGTLQPAAIPPSLAVAMLLALEFSNGGLVTEKDDHDITGGISLMKFSLFKLW